MRARTEDGEPLTDRELRDELLTLVLAGFETTANSLAWTWERLVRNPAAYDERLRDAVRDGRRRPRSTSRRRSSRRMRTAGDPGDRAAGPPCRGAWASTRTRRADPDHVMSILLLHHREDLYPDPFAYRPERWLTAGARSVSPGPTSGSPSAAAPGAASAPRWRWPSSASCSKRWSDGSTWQCRPTRPEHAQHRNVTMIPARGARVVVRERRA
jgi:hypothetical protein